jgi:hypothetical protein
MLEYYEMFITGLAARDKLPTFEELTGCLLQEEERHRYLKPKNTGLALWSNKTSSKGRLGERFRGVSSLQRKQYPRPNQGMQSNRNESKSCFYCG